jgi:DNA-binding MarR family transcriptional regulator
MQTDTADTVVSVLRAIRNGASSYRDIEAATKLRSQTVTATVKAAEGSGYVQRSGYARGMVRALTPAGDAYLRTLEAPTQATATNAAPETPEPPPERSEAPASAPTAAPVSEAPPVRLTAYTAPHATGPDLSKWLAEVDAAIAELQARRAWLVQAMGR